jgi:hypothetical protein
MHPCRFSGPDDGSKVVRILYPVEDDQERRFPLLASRLENVPRAAVGLRRDEGNDALVIAARNQAVEGRRWLDMDGDTVGLRLLDKIGKLAIDPLH